MRNRDKAALGGLGLKHLLVRHRHRAGALFGHRGEFLFREHSPGSQPHCCCWRSTVFIRPTSCLADLDVGGIPPETHGVVKLGLLHLDADSPYHQRFRLELTACGEACRKAIEQVERS